MKHTVSKVGLAAVLISGAAALLYTLVSAAADESRPDDQAARFRPRLSSDKTTQRDPFELTAVGPSERVETPVSDPRLERAILLLQDKEYTEAIPLLEAELERIPTVEAVWEALGWAYVGSDRQDDAKTLWQQYAALRPDSPKAHSLLAQLAILRSDWRAADRHLSRSLELEPRNYDIRYWYAQNLFRLGRLEPAVAIMDELVREDDMRFDVKTDLARVYALLQNYEESLVLWEDVVDVLPDNLDFRMEYARVLLLVGDLEAADHQARRILAEDQGRMPAMMLRADVAELSQQPELMIRALRELVEQAEDDGVRAQLQVRLAVRYIMLNRKDAAAWPIDLALEQYAAAVESVPHNVPWLNQYASIALMAGRPRIARRITERILNDINPYNQQALRTRFELAMSARDYDAAEQALDLVYDSFDPDNPYRHYDRARIEVARGNYFRAMDELDTFEAAGRRGAVLTLLYHGLTESEWMAKTSTRRLQEHLMALRNAGYTFISVSDIPEYLEKRRQLPDAPPDPPWLARVIDTMRYAVTGHRQLEAAEEAPLEKIAVVTFDDGERTSFQLGTPIAEDLGIPFWMAVITHIEELNALVYAAWEEIQSYAQTGVWEMGSHTMWANTDMPVGPEPEPLVPPLPNRIWLPERHRLETLREWTRRVRHEFEGSRTAIETRLDLEPGQFMAVAYPYADIGQNEGSNVATLLNPIRTILNEASRVHSLGFIVDDRGYTTPDENMLLIRRYEPAWDAEAHDVLEHALMTHPVMMARRLRTEIAVLSDRPYLARDQIALLRRDGYPERRLRELVAFAENRTVTEAAVPGSGPSVEQESQKRLKPSNLYVAAAHHISQGSEAIRLRDNEVRVGFNITPSIGLEYGYRVGTITQVHRTNVWTTVQRTERFSSTETTRETVNGVTSTRQITVDSSTTRQEQTNRVERYRYRAATEAWRLGTTWRIDAATYLSFNVGEKIIDYDEGFERASGKEYGAIGAVTLSWVPYPAMRLTAGYNRDVVPSARKTVFSDAGHFGLLWRICDEWDVNGAAHYASYSDKNALLNMRGALFREIVHRQGVWAGLEAEVYSMDEASSYYWTPYWDTRIAGVLSMRKSYPLYYFKADLRLGRQREDARPEELAQYRNLKAQADDDGTWDPGPRPGSAPSFFVGLGGEYRQRLWRHFDAKINVSVNFLNDYSEHNVSVGLQYNF